MATLMTTTPHWNRRNLWIISSWISCAFLMLLLPNQASSFVAPQSFRSSCTTGRSTNNNKNRIDVSHSLLSAKNKSEEELLEESRLKVLASRRKSIRGTLKYGEQMRFLRQDLGWVDDEEDEDDKKNSSTKTAVTWTAFVVAAGAIALRIGGRAALVSAVGLDFANDNPELQRQLDQILNQASSMSLEKEALLFIAAWTAVKVFLFDAGGVVLALSAGILFGGVWQGAVMSALAATIGSTVCFVLAKLDTPVRTKALQVVEDTPSLRGIEQVVAKDGFKAILTLRLAPILPIPLGLYNYVYGVTNVPYLDFCGGIFFGSLKPYLLDSYLGYFGKSVIDGTAGQNSDGDIILLLALGLSVLVGVFASQLASETWDSVLQEVEAEKEGEEKDKDGVYELEDLVSTSFFGIELPNIFIDAQIQWGMANERIQNMVNVEMEAKVYNYTDNVPASLDPKEFDGAPEKAKYAEWDWTATLFDGLVLSPILFATLAKYSDPAYSDDNDEEIAEDLTKYKTLDERRRNGLLVVDAISDDETPPPTPTATTTSSTDRDKILTRISGLRAKSISRVERIRSLLEEEETVR